MEALRTAVEDAVGHRVEAMAVVRGGDVAASFRVELADGRRLFAKTHPSAPPGFFSTEAASLAWLREADAVPVPSVVAVSDGTDTSPAFLILEWIEEGRPNESTERSLGEGLAALHDAGAPSFGREDRRTTGSRGLPNDPATGLADVLRDVPAAPARPAREGRCGAAHHHDRSPRARRRIVGTLRHR